MIRRIALAVVLCLVPLAAVAQRALPADPILDAMRVGELLEIMSRESIAQGQDLDSSILHGKGGAGWARIVEAIHQPGPWESRMRTTISEDLPQRFVAPVLEFIESGQGQRIVELELSARRAMLDDSVEAAGRARLQALESAHAPLIGQIDRFVEVNDLIDANVVGALNANAAFMRGLEEGSGKAQPGGALSDVWMQEQEIRANTRDWIYTFLTMAYAPLTPDEMDAYIAFSESAAGQAFNTALFAAFDEMFEETSRSTGLALGRMLAGEDI